MLCARRGLLLQIYSFTLKGLALLLLVAPFYFLAVFFPPPPVKLVVHSVQLHDTICIYNIVESHWGKYLVLGRAIRAGSNSFIGWGYLGERRGE